MSDKLRMSAADIRAAAGDIARRFSETPTLSCAFFCAGKDDANEFLSHIQEMLAPSKIDCWVQEGVVVNFTVTTEDNECGQCSIVHEDNADSHRGLGCEVLVACHLDLMGERVKRDFFVPMSASCTVELI